MTIIIRMGLKKQPDKPFMRIYIRVERRDEILKLKNAGVATIEK